MSGESTVHKLPSADQPVSEPRTIAGTCDISLNLSDRRGIKITFPVYSDDSKPDLNKRMDEYQDVLDRQMIRSDILNKEAQITSHTANLKSMKQAYEGLLSQTQKGKKLNSQQKLAMDNYGLQELQAIETIDSLRAAIDEGKRKLAAP